MKCHKDLSASAECNEIPVAYSLVLEAGNRRAGAKSSVKRVKALNVSTVQLVCETAPTNGALPENTHLLISGTGGSWNNSSSLSVLVRVKRGSEFQVESGYQNFRGTGVELLASSTDRVEAQMAIDRHPVLATVVNRQGSLSIFLRLIEDGVPVESDPPEVASLAPMTHGSAKQREWATQIRREFILSHPEAAEKLRSTDACWWIDNRNRLSSAINQG